MTMRKNKLSFALCSTITLAVAAGCGEDSKCDDGPVNSAAGQGGGAEGDDTRSDAGAEADDGRRSAGGQGGTSGGDAVGTGGEPPAGSGPGDTGGNGASGELGGGANSGGLGSAGTGGRRADTGGNTSTGGDSGAPTGTGGRQGLGGGGTGGGQALGGTENQGGTTHSGGAGGGDTGGTSGDGGSDPVPPGEYNLGTNLEGIDYWSVYAPYADMARALCSNQGSCWQAPDQDADVAVDDSGYPTQEACATTWAPYPSGEYLVTWEGSGTFRSEGDDSFVIDADGHSGTLTFTADAYPTFCVTPPVSALRIMSPASEAESGYTFRREFLRRMQPFSTLRMMDLGKTNSNFSVSWSERAWPQDYSSARAQGMPYEDMIRLANESHKDLWVNVPAYADDDYVCRMARLFRYGESGSKVDEGSCDPTAPGAPSAGAVALDPGITLYVELGNELWNWGFPAKSNLYCMVHGTFDDGTSDGCFSTVPTSDYGTAALADPSLPWDETDTYAKAAQYIALLGWHMGSVFKTVFAGAPNRVVVAMDGQAAWPEEARTKLTFLDGAFGDWREAVDVLAIAPYIHVEEDPPASLDALFSVLEDSLVTNREWISQCAALVDEFGISLIAYEGGQHLVANTDDMSHVYYRVQDDPRMYDLYREYLQGWRDIVGPGSLFCHYTFAASSGSWGAWGALTNGELQPGSQKWDALMSLALSPGDATLDGRVDSDDLAVIESNLGSSGAWWEQGDFNHDGTVDETDVALYEDNITP